MFEPLYSVTEVNISVILLNISLVSCITAFVLFTISYLFKQKVSDFLFMMGVPPLVLAFLSVFALIVTALVTESVDSHAALENNLKQKYDIAQIIEDDRYEIDTTLETEQFIQVETTDGRKAIFNLTQNMDTFEPTLSELVDNGQAGPVKLEEITK